MNIDRHNYEEFFMLYADNELSAEARRDVELFVQENPDLAEELSILKQLQLRPDAEIVFVGKETLLRTGAEETIINVSNYEEFFVLYADNELTNESQSAVEKFVYKNPQFQAEFELIQQAKLEADTNVVYENKEGLYRHEKDEKVVPLFISMRTWRWVAAAVFILAAGLFWINQKPADKPKDTAVKTEIDKSKGDQSKPTVNEQPKKDQEAIAKETPAENKEVVPKEKTTTVLPDQKNVATAVPNKKIQKPVQVEKKNIVEEKELVASIDPPVVENQTSVDNGKNIATVEKQVTNTIAHKDPIIDQPIYVDTDKPDREIRYANLDENKKDDVLYVSNASIKKQNPLRGLFRKASRFVERTTNSNKGEGSGILIGNVSLALK